MRKKIYIIERPNYWYAHPRVMKPAVVFIGLVLLLVFADRGRTQPIEIPADNPRLHSCYCSCDFHAREQRWTWEQYKICIRGCDQRYGGQ